MPKIIAIGRKSNDFHNWLPEVNCGIFTYDEPDKNDCLLVKKALTSFAGKEEAQGLWDNWQAAKKFYKTRGLDAKIDIDFVAYLMFLKKFFCLILEVQPKVEKSYTLSVVAEMLGKSRQRICQVVQKTPGAYQMPNKRRSWLIPESGIEFLRKKFERKNIKFSIIAQNTELVVY